VALLDLMKPMSSGVKRVLVAQMWFALLSSLLFAFFVIPFRLIFVFRSKFDRLVTQTDIVRFLFANLTKLGPKVEMSLEEIGLVRSASHLIDFTCNLRSQVDVIIN